MWQNVSRINPSSIRTTKRAYTLPEATSGKGSLILEYKYQSVQYECHGTFLKQLGLVPIRDVLY